MSTIPACGAAPRDFSDDRIGVILAATKEGRVVSKEHMLDSYHGVIRDPASDEAGLCAYIDPDPDHVGWKGVEFYVPCKSAARSLFIYCDRPNGNRQSCYEYVHLGRDIDATLFLQRRILKDHHSIVDAVSKLCSRSCVRLRTTGTNSQWLNTVRENADGDATMRLMRRRFISCAPPGGARKYQPRSLPLVIIPADDNDRGHSCRRR